MIVTALFVTVAACASSLLAAGIWCGVRMCLAGRGISRCDMNQLREKQGLVDRYYGRCVGFTIAAMVLGWALIFFGENLQ